MRYVVLDLEATCWENDPFKQKAESETIEIGAVLVNEKFEILGQFQAFVKPVINPILTEYCTNLTHITQHEVDAADTFDVQYQKFLNWADSPDRFIGWGGYDFNQITKDCRRFNIERRISNTRYKNGKILYKEILNQEDVGRGLGKELKRWNIPFQGTHHRALDDAIMTSILLKTIREHASTRS